MWIVRNLSLAFKHLNVNVVVLNIYVAFLIACCQKIAVIYIGINKVITSNQLNGNKK